MRFLIVFALLAGASAAQSATPAAPAAPATPAAATPAKTAAANDGDKLICRREMDTGSNIPGKKMCVRKRDLEAQQQANRDNAKAMTEGSSFKSGN